MAVTERLCAYCAYMNLEVLKEGKFQCDHDHEWRFADDEVAKECYKFCEIFWSKLDEAREAVEQSRTYRNAISSSSPSCYITTVVVKLLGFQDNCHELEVLRRFRSEVMTKDEKYKDLLMKYDTLGPAIARALERGADVDFAYDLYKIYIKGAVSYIEAGDYDSAVSLYAEMTENLINSKIMSVVIPENFGSVYDYTVGGHGRIEAKSI